jgi:hypothetical protein
MTGYELKLFLAKHQGMEKIDAIKMKCAYQFELYEMALRELKIKSSKDVEQAMMA